MNMRYSRRMSPVINVQGKPISAASGAASAQKTSIAMVRIMSRCASREPAAQCDDGAGRLRLALQPRRPARALFRCNLSISLSS